MTAKDDVMLNLFITASFGVFCGLNNQILKTTK